jgi:hypothetical protein
MSGTPTPPPPRPARRGIFCPCGGRTEVYSVHRPCAGLVIRYRLCLVCRGRVTTREAVLHARPPRPPRPPRPKGC